MPEFPLWNLFILMKWPELLLLWNSDGLSLVLGTIGMASCQGLLNSVRHTNTLSFWIRIISTSAVISTQAGLFNGDVTLCLYPSI